MPDLNDIFDAIAERERLGRLFTEKEVGGFELEYGQICQEGK